MKVFKVTPKRIKRAIGIVLTPEMTVAVTMQMHSTTPFANGAKEDVDAYMRIYGYDYKKACCNAGDFDYQALG
ncbi:MAG: DUF6140 family protein [Bacteroidaceae bacterium]|nr:DUF6140 family protein [Bacteroidaceae bacterium]